MQLRKGSIKVNYIYPSVFFFQEKVYFIAIEIDSIIFHVKKKKERLNK